MKATALAPALSYVGVVILTACGTESTLPSELDVGRARFSAYAFSADGPPWSPPQNLGPPVSSPTANDQTPALSSDGLALYFASNRLGGSGGNDLWVSRRASTAGPWSIPVNLGPVVNSAAGDAGPSLSLDGLRLFFTSTRGGGAGGNDIYMTARTDPTDDLSWGVPIRLGPDVNTTLFEFSPFIAPCIHIDGAAGSCVAELYFERGASNVTTDIFVVMINARGETFGPAVAVAELNSSDADGHPTVSFDGREVLLHSNRDGRGGNFDLFMSTRRSHSDRWSTPVPVAELNSSPSHEIHPSLSKDGRTVVFVRGSGQANDIWMSTRAQRSH